MPAMPEVKTKKSPRRRKAANSPIPSGPIQDAGGTCGHSGCGTTCKVRFVGPTSNIRDHSIMHAARGVTNVWTAAIVAGLAVVLTGAIAYTAVQAEGTATTDAKDAAVMQQLSAINQRVSELEATISRQADAIQAAQPADQGKKTQ